jgi:hypothetical protein
MALRQAAAQLLPRVLSGSLASQAQAASTQCGRVLQEALAGASGREDQHQLHHVRGARLPAPLAYQPAHLGSSLLLCLHALHGPRWLIAGFGAPAASGSALDLVKPSTASTGLTTLTKLSLTPSNKIA